MQKAIARARQIGNPIELILLPDDDTDWDELHNFYTKLGFVSDTKSPAIMRMEITNLK
jgi:hypothetical protein